MNGFIKKMKPQEVIDNTKAEILEGLKDKLSEIGKDDSKEVYFYDIVFNAVDCNTPTDRMEAIALIDETGLEEHIDRGLIDTSSLDRTLITTAYSCLEQAVFEDDFFVGDLQNKLNNENIYHEKASKIIELIDQELQKYGKIVHMDSANQIWVKVASMSRGKESEFLLSDFERRFPNENIENGQIHDMSDHSFKIFTSNKEINKNAIVMEGTDKPEFRIYLMSKDADLDIRKLFRVTPDTIKEGNYSLEIDLYVNGRLKKEYKDKDELVRAVFKVTNKLLTERGQKNEKCNC